MKVTRFTREALAYRRQQRDLKAEGYILLGDPYWPIDRGGEWRKEIVDVKIAAGGKQLYIKLGEKPA